MDTNSNMPSPRSLANSELAWLYHNINHDEVSERLALAGVAAQLAVADELAQVRTELQRLAKQAEEWSKNGLGVATLPY